MSRAKTEEEVRAELLSYFHGLVDYWHGESRITDTKGKLEGLVHSLLVALDGEGPFPAFDIVLHPHPSDRKFHSDMGEDWYEPGQCINGSVMLHDEWYR